MVVETKFRRKIVKKLKEREIETVTDLNLRQAVAKNGHILHDDMKVDKLDLFFSYNAGETDTVPNVSLSGT